MRRRRHVIWWEGGREQAKYPDLGGQYQRLIQAMVAEFTAYGIVSILDLHWTDDDTENAPMARPPYDSHVFTSVICLLEIRE